MDSGGEVDLWNNAFIVFRPDAIVTRSVSNAIDVLSENGFSILKTYQFQYTHLTVRECWRYQTNINTRDRIVLMDLLMTSAPSLLCLLRAECGDGDLPATVRLKLLKGPSAPEKRKLGQIRYAMGGVQAPMYSLVHAPDEPVDLLRELAIFLEPAQRRQAYALLAAEPRPLNGREVQAALAEVYERAPAHDLCTASVLDALRQRGRVSAKLLLDIENGAPLPVHETLDELRADPDFSQLDAVAIAARIGEGHVNGEATVLPDANPLDWARVLEAN
jgi:nucleoside diphosphate kinase